MSTSELFLLAMALIFAVPWLVWRLFAIDHLAPLAVVQIIGGVLLGPGIAGALWPEPHAALFTPQVLVALNGIAWWAVMLFVFLAGLELNLAEAWEHRNETAVAAGLALVVPLLLGSVAAWAMLSMNPLWRGAAANDVQTIFGIGMACAVTALPILVLLLEKLDILHSNLGQRILRYACFDDIAIWFVLALILLDWQRIGHQGLFLIAFAGLSMLIRKLMPRLGTMDRWHVCLVWLALVGFMSDWAGLHFMVGAFLAGVVIDAKWFETATRDQFRNVILTTVMPVFFLSTGLRTSWDIGGTTVWLAGLLLLVVSVAGKLLGLMVAGKLLGWRQGEAITIGWLLQTKALIMIVFANVLLDKAIISAATFTALILMAIASTSLTIPMVRHRLKMLI